MYLGRQKPTETTSSVLRSTYTGNGSTSTYALPGPVANETSIIATINGVTQQDDAYSTDGSNIIFSGVPALGDLIEVRTLSAVAMSYAPMDGSVVTGKIADLAVTTNKIADNSITTAKIAAGAVIQADLASGVAGTGPAFFARRATSQTISFATATKVQLDTEIFDTNSCFDSTTNYRFTPTVEGYYQMAFAVRGTGSTTNTGLSATLYKNGGALISSTSTSASSVQAQFATSGGLVYLNGSTDYVELYATITGTGAASLGAANADGSFQTWMSGALVRAA